MSLQSGSLVFNAWIVVYVDPRTLHNVAQIRISRSWRALVIIDLVWMQGVSGRANNDDPGSGFCRLGQPHDATSTVLRLCMKLRAKKLSIECFGTVSVEKVVCLFRVSGNVWISKTMNSEYYISSHFFLCHFRSRGELYTTLLTTFHICIHFSSPVQQQSCPRAASSAAPWHRRKPAQYCDVWLGSGHVLFQGCQEDRLKKQHVVQICKLLNVGQTGRCGIRSIRGSKNAFERRIRRRRT
jgi:hypothetical protein